MKTDRQGNLIGDGSYNIEPVLFDMPFFVDIQVSKSETTESTYVTYVNTENSKRITVRFSNHNSNAVMFGDQLNGFNTDINEVLFNLGLKNRVFIPDTRLMIMTTMVKKSTIENYEVSDLTIQELYRLGEGADISKYTGKIAKNSNILIQGNKVEKINVKKQDCFGNSLLAGRYIYE